MITCNAPAKINLFLNILGLRSDGYHEIESVFHTVSLCDRVTVAPAERLSVSFDVDDIDPDENTVVSAYHALARFVRFRGVELPPVSVRVEKRIPAGTGLGGGSSDAAALLVAMNRLFGLGLTRQHLVEVGASVGSDVPFFLYGGACLVTGRGERVRPLQGSLAGRVVIAVPPVRVATTFAYELWDRKGSPSGAPVTPLLGALADGDWRGVGRSLHNSFLEVLVSEVDEIRTFDAALRKLGLPYGLSGSGSAFFVLAETDEQAERVERALEGVADAVFHAFPVRASEEGYVACE